MAHHFKTIMSKANQMHVYPLELRGRSHRAPGTIIISFNLSWTGIGSGNRRDLERSVPQLYTRLVTEARVHTAVTNEHGPRLRKTLTAKHVQVA